LCIFVIGNFSWHLDHCSRKGEIFTPCKTLEWWWLYPKELGLCSTSPHVRALCYDNAELPLGFFTLHLKHLVDSDVFLCYWPPWKCVLKAFRPKKSSTLCFLFLFLFLLQRSKALDFSHGTNFASYQLGMWKIHKSNPMFGSMGSTTLWSFLPSLKAFFFKKKKNPNPN